jgi:dTDP-4-amino-4,6-dideoxygalactose transaminase
MIPLMDLAAQQTRIGGGIQAAIARVLAHGAYIMGPEVATFERQLADFCGAKHALGVANGTDALGMALMALGVKKGDAILTPAFTFAATAEVAAWLDATAVFVDVLEDTFNMDPASLEQGIEAAKRAGLRPVGVIPVDLFGQPADYDAIEPIAAAHGLWLLTDAAQSFGATWRDRKVGTIGRITATSFFPSKPLGCYGDGGAVLTDDPDLLATMKSIRVHGQGTDKYDNVRVGMNARLDTIQAAILIEKLAVFADEIEARDRVATRYSAALADMVPVPRVLDGARSAWAQYTLRIDGGRRDAVAAALKAAGIATAVYYPRPLHRQTAYRDWPVAGNGLPVSERLAEQVLSLPMHPYLDPATQDRVIEALRAALRT